MYSKYEKTGKHLEVVPRSLRSAHEILADRWKKNIPDKHQRHQQLDGEFSTQKAEPSLFQEWSHWKHRCQLISLDWYLFSTLRNHARHVCCRFFFNFLAQHLSLFNPIGSQSRNAQPHPACPPVEDDVPSWAFCTEGSTNMTWRSAPRDFVRQNWSVSLPGSQQAQYITDNQMCNFSALTYFQIKIIKGAPNVVECNL